MATTTNYSWSTPDDTALVKDGAAAIRSLGTAIDTTVFTNAGAAVAKATVDAKGDLIAGTADNTVARLAVGANGTTLVADSSEATGLKWATPAAGGMTLISTTTLTGASVTLSSIPQTHINLLLIISGVTGNTSNNQINIRPNDVGNLASGAGSRFYSSAFDAQGFFNTAILPYNNQSSLRTDADNVAALLIYNYTSTTAFKPLSYSSQFLGTDSNKYGGGGGGNFASTTAITSLVINYGGTNTFAGGTVLLYGVS